MAVNPFERILGLERQFPGEHLVKGDTEGIQISAIIDQIGSCDPSVRATYRQVFRQC